MQPVHSTLVVPNRSNYVNIVSELIDENRVFHDTHVSVRFKNGFKDFIYPDYLQRNMTNRYAVQVLNDVMFKLPGDVQSVLLDKISGFQSWITAKMYCTDSAIELYAQKVLKNLNVFHLRNKATETFLRHKFKQLVASSTRDELDKLLIEYKKENNPLQKTAFWLHLLIQKVTFVASIALKIVAIPLALIFSVSFVCCAGVIFNNVMLYVNKKITLLAAEIIAVSALIFGAALLISFTRLMKYNFIKVPVNVLISAVLPIFIILEKFHNLPDKIGYYLYELFQKVSLSVADTMGGHSAFYARMRRSCDLKDAENLFVHQVKQLRVQAR